MSDPADKKPPDNTEPLIAYLEKQLHEMDTAELLRDMTPEMLAEKGFLGDKPIGIRRTVNRQATEKEHLLFADGIEFERFSDSDTFETVELSSLLHIADVKKGQLIASRSADERTPFEAGQNVQKNIVDGVERFHATVRGKPFIIKDALYVMPSDVDCKIAVRLDVLKMYAFLDCIPACGDGRPLTVAYARAELIRQGISHGINEIKLESTITEANQFHRTLTDITIAIGTPSVPSKPGAVEYAFDTKPREYDFRILPDGKIDYRNSKSILTATENQLLARIGTAIPGVPGKTVCGEAVPVDEVSNATLIPGSGVRVSPDGREFFAAIAGSIVLNGSMLDVVNMYVVDGDVDFSTGNISFNGNVFISGTVHDGFEVRADGDIVVAKIVESARLEAGRDIIINGGVLGRGKGLIAAGRDIKIDYAQNARLEAQGIITIGNFVINSYIATSSRLVALEKRGAIIGGEVFTLRGVDAKSIGSEAGVKTYVESGTDYLVMRTVGELDTAIAFCEQHTRKIDETLKMIVGKIGPGAVMPPAMKQPMLKALQKKRDLQQRTTIMQAKRADLKKIALGKESCFVKVKGTCYSDVTIKIKELKTTVTTAREHVRFYDDKKTEEIGVGAY